MCKPTTDNDTTNGNNNGNVADDTVDNVSQEVTATKAQEEVHQVPPEEAEEEAAVGTPSTLSEEELEELETDEVYNKDEAEIEAETEEAEVADEEQDPQAIEKEDVATVATSTTTTTTTSSSTPAPADETVMAAKDVAVVAEEQELPVEEPEIDEDTKIFLQIVTTKANFGQGDEAACKKLLAEFSEEDVEEIASASHAYWYIRRYSPELMPESAREISALKEVRRHYVGEGRKHDKGLAVLKEALVFRRKYKVTLARSCFSKDLKTTTASEQPVEDSQESLDEDMKRYRDSVRAESARQLMLVRGADAENRVIVFKPPRGTRTNDKDTEAYILTQIYSSERAMACTEYRSRGKMERLITVFSFQKFDSKNSITRNCMKESASVMQRLYPERLQTLIVIEPPFWMKAIYKVVSPFLSRSTRDKVRLANSNNDLLNFFNFDHDENLKGILSAGTLSTSCDVERYLNDVPFYRLYDDSIATSTTTSTTP